MSDLRAPLRDYLEDPADDQHSARLVEGAMVRRRAAMAEPPRRRSRWTLPAAVVAGAAAATLLIIAATLWWYPSDPSEATTTTTPIQLVDGSDLVRLEADTTVRHVRLSDGSVIDLEPGSVLVPRANDGEQITLALVRGAATFDIAPGGPRRWLVEAEVAQVVVEGTRFRVDHRPGEVRVVVSRGSITVEGDLVPGGVRRLVAGESIVVSREVRGAAVDNDPQAAADAGARNENDAAPLKTDAGAWRRSAPRARSSWRELAREGEFGSAFDNLGSSGVAREARQAATMDELLTLADVARLSGHPRDAIEPLERALHLHAGDRRAPVAAFTLGRIELHALGRPGRAARAFERCLELGAPRALREDAHARLAQARQRAGDHSGARAAARDYLRLFPEGRWAEQARQLSAESP